MPYAHTADRTATAWKHLLVPDEELPALLAEAREKYTKGNLLENDGPDLDNAADEDPEGDDLHEDEQALKPAQRMCKFPALRLAFGNPSASDLHKAALSGSSGSSSSAHVTSCTVFAHCVFLRFC